MDTLWKIAWRNVWRHGRRTALTIVTMAFGLGLYIGMDSILKGMDRGGLDNIVNLSDSSVRVSTAAYEAERGSLPLSHGLPDAAALERFLSGRSGVEATSLRTRFVGRLSNGIDAVPVLAIAVDPERDPRVLDLPDFVEGEWLSVADAGKAGGELPGGAAARRVVLGHRLAAELGLGLGDWVTLAAQTRWESRNADDFLVAGIVNCPEPGINGGGVFLSLSDAEEFLELDGLRTEAIVRMARRVNLKDAMADSDALAADIEARFPVLDARSFGDVGRQFLELSKAKSKSIGIIIVVMMLIAGVGIANTILMSVYSRIREIGVLRAFGLRPKDISRLFLIEGGILGTIGSLAGVAFGIGLDAYFILVGFPIEAMMGEIDMGLPIWGALRGEWNPDQMIVAFVVGVIVALLSSRAPARRASRLEVTNALRFA